MSDIEKGNPSPQLDDNDIKSTPIITTTSQTNGEIIEFGKKIHLDTNKVDDAMELALRASFKLILNQTGNYLGKLT